MNISTNVNILLVDGCPIRDMGHPIEGAVLREGVIVVILFTRPTTSRYKYLADNLAHPEQYDESNRNVYGINPNGDSRWRIESVGNPRGRASAPFNRILVAGDLTLLENEWFYRLDPKSGAINVYSMPDTFSKIKEQADRMGETVSWYPSVCRGSSPNKWPPNITIDQARCSLS